MSSIAGSTPFPWTNVIALGSVTPDGWRGLRAARHRPASRRSPMNLRALVPAFATHLRARSAAVRTLASYERTVLAFLDVAGAAAATRADVERFLARPRADGSPRAASTKRAELMALRAFFRFVDTATDPTAGLRIKRERRAEPSVVMPVEVAPLFEAAACSAAPKRSVLVVGLLVVLGLRVHELALLEVRHIDLVAAMLRNVRRKGGVVSNIPLPEPLVALVREWLRERTMMGHGDGALFPTARPSASRTGHLSVRSLQRLVNRLAADAGLGRRLGPHALRHGCATAAISLGIDVPTTAECLEHRSIATTQTYVHLARDARRAAFERLATLIPPAVLPAGVLPSSEPRNPSGNPPDDGVLAPVDIHPA